MTTGLPVLGGLAQAGAPYDTRPHDLQTMLGFGSQRLVLRRAAHNAGMETRGGLDASQDLSAEPFRGCLLAGSRTRDYVREWPEIQ